jgi:glucose/arabinose dehydrogenase
MEPVSVLPRLRRAVLVALGGCALLAAARAAGAASVRNPTTAGAISDVRLQQVASGLGSITSIAAAGDSRLFLTLAGGRIVIWNGTRALRTAFLDISSRVSCCGGRGLLSVAFHPDYASNGLFFVSYTDAAGNLVIARYRRSATKPNRTDASSGVVLLTIPYPANADHHGGQLQFGPDGYLYAGIGDASSAQRPNRGAQRDDVLLGKILRLDVNANAARPPFYGIPPSNPLAATPAARGEIWAKGLRDPWRFSFDRLTGDLYIGDVGQSVREEIDFQPGSSRGGENYGWKIMEGSLRRAAGKSGLRAGSPSQAPESLRSPILEYGHDSGDCAVAGGYVYRGNDDPRLAGVYFYGDYCTGHIWGDGQLTNVVAPNLTTFGEDSRGELYVATGKGVLYRIVSPMPIAQQPRYPVEEPSEVESVPSAAEPVSPAVRLFPWVEEPKPVEAPPPSAPAPPPAASVWVVEPPEIPEPSPDVASPPDTPAPPPTTHTEPVPPKPAPPPEPPPETPTPPPTPAPTPAPPSQPDRQNPTVVPRELPPPRTVNPHG